jgi:hypothetical protein
MAALSSFIPMVAPMVAGAPSIAIENAALYSAIDFCSRTLALQRSIASVNTVANQAEYTLTQAGEVVHKLLAVKLADEPLHLLTPAQLDREQEPDPVETPWAAVLTAPMKLRLYPAPKSSSIAIVARAAMRPSQAATTIDDDLFERYGQAIADGAAGWLMQQPAAAYFNPQGAIEAKQRFLDAVALAKAAVFVGHARTAARPRINWC